MHRKAFVRTRRAAPPPQAPAAPPKFYLSLELPIEYKERFEHLADTEHRTVRQQAVHILTTAVDALLPLAPQVP